MPGYPGFFFHSYSKVALYLYTMAGVGVNQMNLLPTGDDLEAIEADGGSLASVLAFTGIDSDLGMNFLEKIDLDATSHYSICSELDRNDIDGVLKEMVKDGQPLTIGIKAKLRLALRIGRALTGVAEPPMIQPAPVTPTPASSSTTLALKSATGDPIDTVKLSETVLQGNNAVIKLMSDEELARVRGVYEEEVGDEPPEEEDVTIEQLTALDTVVRVLGRIYCDFALWVPFWNRMVKALKFQGKVINEHGEIILVEILAPPQTSMRGFVVISFSGHPPECTG